ncbi:hypothetical protein Ahy_B08g090503 [Arachis hypogaea]|uniref:Large ribosomal subunit protein uL15/eL18 domain-containing protein n=1 Tax=Arachis hypogaea TaxID=3818 RepID=A0A444Y070_ARAHY|nr:hypothetical protein Ahy_B08g090503 [Arachis hypogaea]
MGKLYKGFYGRCLTTVTEVPRELIEAVQEPLPFSRGSRQECLEVQKGKAFYNFQFNTRLEGKIAMVVETVTDDIRVSEVHALKVTTLMFIETTRARIEMALALRAPLGQNTVILRGPKNSREAVKQFGPALGVPQSHTKPYVRSKGSKFEKHVEKSEF